MICLLLFVVTSCWLVVCCCSLPSLLLLLLWYLFCDIGVNYQESKDSIYYRQLVPRLLRTMANTFGTYPTDTHMSIRIYSCACVIYQKTRQYCWKLFLAIFSYAVRFVCVCVWKGGGMQAFHTVGQKKGKNSVYVLLLYELQGRLSHHNSSIQLFGL